MHQYQLAFGIASLIIAVISYTFYIYNLLSNKNKPHAFSWFIWGLLTTIVFFAQYEKGAGAGSWVTALTAFACFLIAATSFLKLGIPYVKKIDWFCLFAALLAVILWKATSDPFDAVLIVTVAYLIGFVPTFRKGYRKPYEETAITFALNGLKFALGITALEFFSITTWLYPLSLVVANWVFFTTLMIRRRKK